MFREIGVTWGPARLGVVLKKSTSSAHQVLHMPTVSGCVCVCVGGGDAWVLGSEKPPGDGGQYKETTFIVTTRGCYLLSGLRPGVLLNILQYTGCPTAQQHPAPRC